MKYDSQKIEKHWQKIWEKKKIYAAKDGSKKPKKYVLIEFPYPSGEGLHMGHLRPYIAGDVYSRFSRMNGYETMYPIGWDAFGLPAENYAIKNGVHPSVSTARNIANAKAQVKSWGIGFDWPREINTTDPAYYKWTQWLFLQFFKAGLAYEAEGLINWCPKDKTGLANEEVINDCCERCGTKVGKKKLRQWYLKITAYAEKLLKGLKKLDWPEPIKIQQENWIGKSEGAEIEFSIPNSQFSIKVFTTRPDTLFGATYMVLAPEHPLLANGKLQIANRKEINIYIKNAKAKSEEERAVEGKEKTGVELKGVKAINPATKEKIPIWVADYVLAGYGTGAIMAVPAHDERDWEFAKKYNLPIVEVVEPLFVKTDGIDGVRPSLPLKERNAVVAVVKHWSEDKYLCLKWKKTDWRGFIIGGIEKDEDIAEAAAREIREETGYKSAKFVRELGGIVHARFYHAVKNENRWARFRGLYFELADGEKEDTADEEKQIHDAVWVEKKEVDRFLDWVTDMRLIWHRALHPDDFPGRSALHESSRVSEQGILTRSEKFDGMIAGEAKWKITDFVGGKRKVQYRLRDWVFSRQRYWGEPIPLIHCGKCGVVPVPEKDLPVKLPDVKKYEPTGTGESPLAAVKSWVGVKCPKCGGPAKRETNTMPQWAGSSWYYLRYCDPKNKKEFAGQKFLKRWLPVDVYFGGLEHTTLHLLYSRFWHLFLRDKKLVPTPEPYAKRIPHGIILGPDGEKMSKSRGNVVNPDAIVKEFGADCLRMYVLFLGPHEATVSWSSQGILGVSRFLGRVCKKFSEPPVEKSSKKAEQAVHRAVKKIGEDIQSAKFNTATSALMVCLNEIENEPLSGSSRGMFLKILAPFAPHTSEELWQRLANGKRQRANREFTSVHLEKWPKYDPKLVHEKTFTLIIQVNGKVRDSVEAAAGIGKDEAEKMALQREKISRFAGSHKSKKVIYIPDKLINIVI